MWVSTIFGEGLEGLGSDKDVFKNNESGRKIASVDDGSSPITTGYKIPIYWLVIIFGLLGAAHLRKTKA